MVVCLCLFVKVFDSDMVRIGLMLLVEVSFDYVVLVFGVILVWVIVVLCVLLMWVWWFCCVVVFCLVSVVRLVL